MNLREKFIWNLAIVFSIIMILWNAWTQYSNHSDVSKAYKKYKNEKVGSDKELQNMVAVLESNLNDRRSIKFKTKTNPFEITKVIVVDGSLASRGVKGIDCKGAWSNTEGSYTAVCNYKAKRYEVTVGDSIGGGVVNDISATKVFIEKDDQIIIFNFGLDRYEAN